MLSLWDIPADAAQFLERTCPNATVPGASWAGCSAFRNAATRRAAFQAALNHSREVIEWGAPALLSYRSNNVNIPSGSARVATTGLSDYREIAERIQEATRAELDKLSEDIPAPAAARKSTGKRRLASLSATTYFGIAVKKDA